jgi:glycosyltransferase involved in cell wall biosynthesis
VFEWVALLYERYLFKKSDAAVFSSRMIMENVQSRCMSLPQVVEVIPNYIVPRIWSPPHHIENQETVVRLIYFGRFSAQKNLGNLIQGIRQLPVHLILIGEGSNFDELQRLIKQCKVSCEILPRLPQHKLVEVLRTCDLFVLPSLYEGHPKALIEAMALGIPALVADSPGIAESVTPGVSAIKMKTTVDGIRSGVKSFIALSREERSLIGKIVVKLLS